MGRDRSARNAGQRRSTGWMTYGRKFVKDVQTIPISPNEIVVKKHRSLVNASRSRIVGRRHVN